MSIEPKKKTCVICGESKILFSKGRCLQCTPKKPLQRTAIKQKAYRITKQTEKNREKRLAQREGYGDFFKKHVDYVLNNDVHCQECGNKLQGLSGEVCHILSKSKSPEVAKNDNNILYLCFYGNSCHSKFDNSLEVRSKMKVFKIAIEKFKKLKNLIINFTKEVEQLTENER